MEKLTINGPFSIVMLNYQRVLSGKSGNQTWYGLLMSAKKNEIFNMFSPSNPPFSSGISQPATFWLPEGMLVELVGEFTHLQTPTPQVGIG